MKANNFFKHILCIFYPQRCPYCSRIIEPQEHACRDCKDTFPKHGFLTVAMSGYSCVSPFLYKERFSKAVKHFKFYNKPQYAPLLAVPVVQQVKRQYQNIAFDFVTSVPLHKNSRKQRGYNQSALLGKEVAKLLNVPYQETLWKIKENKIQHSLTKKERAKNIKNAYQASCPEQIQGKTILLCDDIVTTGYTLGECSKTLDKYAPKDIFCATICYVLPK